MKLFGFSVVLFEEHGSYSSWCPEVDVASQGDTVDKAIANLKEALELHLECLSPSELQELKKRHGKKLLTTLEVALPA